MESDNGMHRLLREIFPLCRSITGRGVRQTLQRIGEEIPVRCTEIPSGTAVLDWIVPEEWNIREAWIEGPDGMRLVDFANHSLHVVSYSLPIEATLTLEQLDPHLHSLPDQPDVIPYRTSYYQRSWGFCLPDRLRTSLTVGNYRVRIDSDIASGHLTYGEIYLPGSSTDEVVLSAHVCHPSLANDNLSGVVIAVEIAKWLQAMEGRKLSYRILLAPGTIGSIAWLSENRASLHRIRYGLVLNGLGGPHPWTYKRSRRGDHRIDRITESILKRRSPESVVESYSPYGYDERQYCSPGFQLPFGSLSRAPWGSYPEYHTSGDNPEFVTATSLQESAELIKEILRAMVSERESDDGLYIGTVLYGEPQLGRHGLYGTAGDIDTMALLWVLNYSDGEHTLSEISVRSRIPVERLVQAAKRLQERGLLSRPL
jgi:aminopeptidase-like protein